MNTVYIASIKPTWHKAAAEVDFVKYKMDIIDCSTYETIIVDLNSIPDISNSYFPMRLWENLIEFTSKRKRIVLLLPSTDVTVGVKFDKRSYNFVKLQEFVSNLNIKIALEYKKLRQFDVLDSIGSEIKYSYYSMKGLHPLVKGKNIEDIVIGYHSPSNLILAPHQYDMDYVMYLSRYAFKKEITVPEWVINYSIFDEGNLIKDNEDKKEKIDLLRDDILQNQETIDRYNHYKKVIFTNGKVLESIVSEILLKMNIDNQLIDGVLVDMKVPFGERMILCEIKGTKGTVKKEHVLQADQWVKDEEKIRPDDFDPSLLSGLIIFNNQMNKPVEERTIEIHPNILKRSEDLGLSIIYTSTLLNIFSDYRELDENKINKLLEALFSNVGLLDSAKLHAILKD